MYIFETYFDLFMSFASLKNNSIQMNVSMRKNELYTYFDDKHDCIWFSLDREAKAMELGYMFNHKLLSFSSADGTTNIEMYKL